MSMLSPSDLSIGNAAFEPGCRDNWHVHKASKGGVQILLRAAAQGWRQEWRKEARPVGEGDAVHVPVGVKHWHGAAKDSPFAHLAVEVPGEGCSTEWLEPVAEADYGKL